MIDQLVQLVAKNLNLDVTKAQSIIGSLLAFLKSTGGDALFKQIADKIPGAAELVSRASAKASGGESGGGGLLGSLTKSIGSMLGGETAAAAGGLSLLGDLSNQGIDGQKASSLVTMVLDFVKQHCGPELVNQITANIPALGQILGEKKA